VFKKKEFGGLWKIGRLKIFMKLQILRNKWLKEYGKYLESIIEKRVQMHSVGKKDKCTK